MEKQQKAMNISLSQKKQQDKKAAYGLLLNKNNNKKSSTTTATTNVFGGGESSSSDDDDDDDTPQKDLRQEQAALRRRAAAAASYDFDGTYENNNQNKKVEKPKEEKRESRYIAQMLKASKRRNHERDVAFDRKAIKEQADEALEAEFMGKEKFVTSAYKRKLAERDLWTKEEEEAEKRNGDVTKDTNMAGFYGNLIKNNVAMGSGGGGQRSEATTNDQRPEEQNEKQKSTTPGFLDGFEAPSSGEKENNDTTGNENEQPPPKPSFLDGFQSAGDSDPKQKDGPVVSEELKPIDNKKSDRQLREEKVKAARKRYFERRGVTDTESSQ